MSAPWCARPRRSCKTSAARITGLALPRLPRQPADARYPFRGGFCLGRSLLNDDIRVCFDCTGGKLIELPFTTSTADKTFIGYPYPMRGGFDGLANVWNSEFDVLYRESEQAPRS